MQLADVRGNRRSYGSSVLSNTNSKNETLYTLKEGRVSYRNECAFCMGKDLTSPAVNQLDGLLRNSMSGTIFNLCDVVPSKKVVQ